MGDHLELPIADLRDADVVPEVAGAALDLDTVVEELFERGQVEDLVADRLAAVDCVLGSKSANLRASCSRETWTCLLGDLCRLAFRGASLHGRKETLSLLSSPRPSLVRKAKVTRGLGYSKAVRSAYLSG